MKSLIIFIGLVLSSCAHIAQQTHACHDNERQHYFNLGMIEYKKNNINTASKLFKKACACGNM